MMKDVHWPFLEGWGHLGVRRWGWLGKRPKVLYRLNSPQDEVHGRLWIRVGLVLGNWVEQIAVAVVVVVVGEILVPGMRTFQ